jgi:hypothetical protein
LLRFTGLKPAEREALDAAIASLADLPERDWPTKGAIRLGLPETTFMLKLGPSLRAFVRPTPGGKPKVLDFVNQETIDWFRSLASTHEPSALLGAGSTSS